METMRVFFSRIRHDGKPLYFRCIIGVPLDVAQRMGLQHRDDLAYTIVGDELRLRRLPERDRNRDHIPGGRYDPVTGKQRWDRGPEGGRALRPEFETPRGTTDPKE
jgi:hypothetical protein